MSRFFWVLQALQDTDYEAPDLIACILFIWLHGCSRACSRVCARQVLKKNKESVFPQFRGRAPQKPQSPFLCWTRTWREGKEAAPLKSCSLSPVSAAHSKLPFTCGLSFVLILKVFFPSTYSVNNTLPNEKASSVLETNISKPVRKTKWQSYADLAL